MTQHATQTDLFKKQLKNSLKTETKNFRSIKFAKHKNIYSVGDTNENVYFIESGQIKLLMLSPTGKECLLAIHSAGDVFGELCLSDTSERLETAMTMEKSFIKEISCARFLRLLTKDELLEGFLRYLTVRIADQQKLITNLATANGEHRLGKVLLRLARKIGEKDPRSIIIRHKITHEELSKMVGTTRSHVTKFMRKFRKRKLIEMSADRFIIVKEKNLNTYLKQHS